MSGKGRLELANLPNNAFEVINPCTHNRHEFAIPRIVPIEVVGCVLYFSNSTVHMGAEVAQRRLQAAHFLKAG